MDETRDNDEICMMEYGCMISDKNIEKDTYPSETKVATALAVDRARLEERLAPIPSITSITALRTKTYRETKRRTQEEECRWV